MRINNNLNESIIMNQYDRKSLIDINDPRLYDINGIEIKPKSSIDIPSHDGKILYFSNISGSKIANISTDMLLSDTLNLWNHTSNIVQCNENSKCRTVDNIAMRSQLPNHIIWYIYNDVTYIIVAMIFAILIATIAFVFINTIKK